MEALLNIHVPQLFSIIKPFEDESIVDFLAYLRLHFVRINPHLAEELQTERLRAVIACILELSSLYSVTGLNNIIRTGHMNDAECGWWNRCEASILYAAKAAESAIVTVQEKGRLCQNAGCKTLSSTLQTRNDSAQLH